MTDFKVIEEHNKEKFEKKIIEFLQSGYELINCTHNDVSDKHTGYVLQR